MPLEFALRPRFNLERPTPRRRLEWLRLPPLALPIAAYWLLIAGVTHALIRSATLDARGGEERAAMSSGSRDVEPPPVPAPLEPEPRPERTLDRLPEARAPAEDRKVVSREPSLTHVQRHVTAPQRSSPAEPVEASTSPAKPVKAFTIPAKPVKAFTRPAEPVEVSTKPRREVPKELVTEQTSRAAPQAASLPSCEGAAANANQTIDLGSARRAPDLTRDAFGAVLDDGAYLANCAIPGSTAIAICAAVQNGKVVGVSVRTEPRDAAISACVRRAVAALRFPQSSQLDVARTRFEPAM